MNHLSSMDASFLHLETPETPMHVGSLIHRHPDDASGTEFPHDREPRCRRHEAPVDPRPHASNARRIYEFTSGERAADSSPAVLYVVAERLAQPEGQWQPFQRRGWRAMVCPGAPSLT